MVNKSAFERLELVYTYVTRSATDTVSGYRAGCSTVHQ